MKAGLVEGPCHIGILAAVIGGASAGDQEDERRRAILQGFRVDHFLAVPDQVRQVTLGKDIEPALLHRDRFRQLGFIALGRTHHRGDKTVLYRVAVIFHRGSGGSESGKRDEQ